MMISVIMGINKHDQFVPLAIRSIINQSYRDWEFIVVANGCGCDKIIEKIKSEFSDEDRIKLITARVGQLAYALNLAIDFARGDYLARMDGDDIAHPDRLRTQLSYLLRNDLDMVGSDACLIDSNGDIIGRRITAKKQKINRVLAFKNPFIHPTILYKKSVLLKVRGYNAGFASEDYDLWLRLNRSGVKWDNINLKLLSYRVHTGSSQGSSLAYAECAALALREFMIRKNFKNFLAIFVHSSKVFLYPVISIFRGICHISKFSQNAKKF